MSRFLQLIIFFFFFLLSCLITYPLIFNLTNLSIGLGDELVISWIMQWVVHAIFSGNFSSFFQANTYYPFANSLAFSDLHLVTSFIGYLPYRVFSEPIVIFNSSLIISLGMFGWSIYLLSFYLTKNYGTSLLAGVLVIFSPAVLDKMTHIQILAIQWVPFAMLFFLKFVETTKRRYLFFSLCFFLLQTYNSFLPGYFIIFFYSITLLNLFLKKDKRLKKLFTIKNVGILFLFLVLLLPIVIPYYQISKGFNYTRDIRETIHFALQPEDLLYASTHSRLAPFLNGLPFNQQSQNDEFKPGFIGLIFSVLAIFSIIYWVRQKKKDEMLTLFSAVSLTGLLMSMGPVLHLGRQTIHDPFPIPLPYLLFYYILPGFQGFRNSARWEMLFIVCIVICIAIVLSKLLQKYSFRKQAIVIVIFFGGTIAEFNFPMQFESVPQVKEFPSVYSWIATTPSDTVIIELPIYNWNMTPYVQDEFLRQYYSTIHFRKMVNGYSGFSPPPWQELVTNQLNYFPSNETIQELKKIGITHVVIHTEEYNRLHKDKFRVEGSIINDSKTILRRIENSGNFILIKKLGDDYVFAIK